MKNYFKTVDEANGLYCYNEDKIKGLLGNEIFIGNRDYDHFYLL